MQNLTNTQGTINKFLDIVKREGNGSALDILEALTRSTLKYDDIGAAFRLSGTSYGTLHFTYFADAMAFGGKRHMRE